MARGFDAHKARQDALGRLGKDLARRARSRCELCEESGVSLSPYEVPPAPEEPALERCLLLCERCRDGGEGRLGEDNQWRFLSETVWAELPATQVVAVRLLRALVAAGAEWADAALESVYLTPEQEAWVEGTPPETLGASQ